VVREEMIERAADLLLRNVPEGSKVILFGSTARGDDRSDSDLDFLVVEPGVVDRFAEMVRLSERLGRDLIPADVVVVDVSSFEKWRNVPNTLAYRAEREGKVYEPIA